MDGTLNSVKKFLVAVGMEMTALQQELTELDSKQGDGDLGISMARGGQALCAACDAYEGSSIAMLIMQCAAALNKAAPSTMGTLLSFAMRAAGKQLKDLDAISEEQAVALFRVCADEIALKGKAKVGDKTILDALYPSADAAEKTYAETHNLRTSLQAAAAAAQNGMEKTKGMVAHIGRAQWLGERNKEYPDGGAVLCWRIAELIARF